MLQVKGQDDATSTLQRVSGSLGSLNDALQRTGVTATQVLRAQQQMESAYASLQSAQDRLSSAQGTLIANQQRAALAVDAYQRALTDLAQATGDTSSQQAAAARAFDSTVAAQQRVVTSTAAVATAYRTLATAQETAGRAQQTYGDISAAPVRMPAERPASGGAGGGVGGTFDVAMNFLKYQLGYQLMYSLQSAITGAFTNNQQLSQLAGQTIASTTMNPADVPRLEAYATGVARGGQEPYNARTITQGAYGFMSQGFSTAQAQAMNQYAIGLSTIGGAQDTSQAATALLAMGNGFGWGSNVGQSARQYANYLQAGANIGAYSLPQIAQSIPNAGLAALTRLGFDPRFVMSAVATGSFSGTSAEETAQNLNSLGQVFAHPNRQQRMYAGALGVDIMPDAMGRAGGAYNWFQTLQQHTADMAPATQQYMLSGLFGNVSAARIVSELFAGTGPRSFQSVYGYMGQSQQGQGFYQQALGIANTTPGQQLANSEAKLTQQFDDMAQKFQPLEVALIQNLGKLADAAGSVADSINKAGGFGQYVEGGMATLGALITPGGPGFGNLQKAQQESYYLLHPTASGAQQYVQHTSLFNPESIPVLGGMAEGFRMLGGAVHNRLGQMGNTAQAMAGVNPYAQGSDDWFRWRAAHWTGGNSPIPATSERDAQRNQQVYAGRLYNPATYQARQLQSSNADIVGALPQMGDAISTALRLGAQYVQQAMQDAHDRNAAQSRGASTVQSAIRASMTGAQGVVYAQRAGNLMQMNVQNAQARVQLAEQQQQPAGVIQSALGLYRQAVNNDPALTGVQRALDVLNATQQAQTVMAQPLTNAVQAIQNSMQIAQAHGATPGQVQALGDAGYNAQRQQARATMRGSQLSGALTDINQQQQLFDFQQQHQAATDLAQAHEMAAQNALNLAQAMNTPPDQLRALGDAAYAAQRQLILASQIGPQQQQSLRTLAGQQAVFDTQTGNDALRRQQQAMQNQIQIDQVQGHPTQWRADQQRLLGFERQHAQALGMTPSDVALVAAQFASEARATLLPIPTPFQQSQAGLYPLAAGPESTNVRIGGGRNLQADEIATLRRELSAANNKIADLLAQIASNTAGGQAARQNTLTATGGNRNHRG